MYPENARPTIIFDEECVCSGCRYHESRSKQLDINWDERVVMFEKIIEEAKRMAKQRGNSHDCIVPVSGGKDSQFQVWLLKEKYGMNPLLVTFNHAYNTPAGNRNLYNLVEKSGCDFVRYTAGLDSVRRISRYMLETVGDLTWHYHAGIRTYPIQVAVERNIPLIVWGEHGFAELTGIVSLEDFVEFTRWTRKEHDMRGYEPHDLIGKGGITVQDIAPYIYPSDEDIARVGLRGIYLSNFFNWNGLNQAKQMMETFGFAPITYERERTFNLHSKIEDHANDVHDYLKYLKFGYGRATDDASMEIRHGRMNREEGVAMVKRYDSREPSTLQTYCDFLEITKQQFYDWVEPMRDQRFWQKDADGVWRAQDAVFLHEIGELEERARVTPSKERTLSAENRRMYFNPANPPLKIGEEALDQPSLSFRVI
jgi:N-acetyl sugar amidotransferase